MANLISYADHKYHIGDTIEVHYKFKEGDKTKQQIFKGILIRIKGADKNKMITVRKLSKDKIGVERIFPLMSLNIDKIKFVKSAKVRRSKLYYIRNLSDRDLRDRVS